VKRAENMLLNVPGERTAVCIGCGCTDAAACRVVPGLGCRWMVLQRSEGKGLCSACVRAGGVRLLDGRLHPDVGFTRLRWIALLAPHYTEEAASLWFERPQKILDDRSPRAVLSAADPLAALAIIRAAIDAMLMPQAQP
jgi:hypothetical protein